MPFYPLNIRRYQPKALVVTPDTIYWNRLSKPELLKEHTNIDYLDFSPSDQDNFVITCSVRVQIYNLVTKLVVKNLSRFQKSAYGATFRQDGRLIAAGDEEGHVKLFDTTSRNILRLFKGHKAPVHRTFFSADQLQLASFSDDKSVRLWDVANEKVVQTYEDAHTDYIRAGAMHPKTTHMFISGGYDGKIKVFDTRSQTIIQSLDHGSPVESMLFLPSGSIFITAGGTQVRVWDMINGCRLLTTMSQHHKTVTCLRLGSDGKRLLSGGLDRHVKIYDINTYKPVHTITYPNAVVSLAVAAKDQAVIAGLVDGLVSIKRMILDTQPSHLKQIKSKYQSQKKRKVTHNKTTPVDHVITGRGKSLKLKEYDNHLRKFDFKKALDCVLTQQIITEYPEQVVGVITELLHRGALASALTNRPEAITITFIEFLCAHIGEVRFMRPLLNAADTQLEVFEQHEVAYSKELLMALEQLKDTMQAEIQLTKDLLQLKGALDMIIGAAMENNDRRSKVSYVPSRLSRMHPSPAAAKYVLVVD